MALENFRNDWGAGNLFEPGSSQCYMPRTYAMNKINGIMDTSIADGQCPEIYNPNPQMDMFVLWGTQPSADSVATGGRALAELREKGVKSVVVDPRLSHDAARADVWLPIRPGTDVALMLAWLNHIVINELYDKEFCTKWSNLPFLIDPNDEGGALLRASKVAGMDVSNGEGYEYYDEGLGCVTKAYALSPENEDGYKPALFGSYEVELADGAVVTAKTGGQAWKEHLEGWTVEKAAEICWLDAESIYKALDIYTSAKSGGISLGVATDQNPNSVQSAMGAAALDTWMGFISKPGALACLSPVGPQWGWNNFGDNRQCTPEAITERYGYVEHKALGQWTHSHNPTTLQAMITGEPYPIHIWIERSGNKFAMLGNSSAWLEGIPNVDLITHSYMYPTSFTFEAADIYMPSTEWLETADSNTRLNWSVPRQPATILYEHIDNTLFFHFMAHCLADMGDPNMQKACDAGLWCATYEEYLETKADPGKTWAETCASAPTQNMTDDEFWASMAYEHTYLDLNEDGAYVGFGKITTPPDITDNPQKNGLYCDINIYAGRYGLEDHVMPAASVDYKPFPWYMEPSESPLDDEEYPLALTGGRLPFYHHGTLRNAPLLREMYPAPELWINPRTAERYGVAAGDWVNIKSRRCEENEVAKDGIFAICCPTEGIGEGVLYMERFWNPEYLEEGQDHRKSWTTSNINLITKNAAPYNPEAGTYTLRGFQVKIEKTERPEGVWYDPTDFEPWMPQPSDNTGGGY
jgi:anaerobic selenocysteine-containing dehydrogenase